MLVGLSLLVLAFAVSLDGFGVGVMYGLRRIRIPFGPLAIISLWSGGVIFSSMLIGTWMSVFLSPLAAKRIGAVILIGIGVWALVQMVRQRSEEQEAEEDAAAPSNRTEPAELALRRGAAAGERNIFTWEIRRFGLVIQILRTPTVADVDKSGNISVSEAMLLGLALSLDSFGAGIGAALIGFSPVPTSVVIALASGTFIAVGLKIGLRYAEMDWMRKLSFLPGCVLIAMGIMKLFA
jgi:putative sporulation protein YtaF